MRTASYYRRTGTKERHILTTEEYRLIRRVLSRAQEELDRNGVRISDEDSQRYKAKLRVQVTAIQLMLAEAGELRGMLQGC